MSILVKDPCGNNVLALFENGITIDQKLPKWVNAGKYNAEGKQSAGDQKHGEQTRFIMRETRTVTTNDGTSTAFVNMDSPFTIYTTPENYAVKESVNFDEIASANLTELTALIKRGELNNILSGYGGMYGGSRNWHATTRPTLEESITFGGPETISGKLKRKISQWLDRKLGEKPEFDAVEFFTNVKLASKEGAVTYRDRVSDYLKAIHNANSIGQTALLEQLLSEMIANKYEAVLESRGAYYAIPELRVVEFAEKTERGVNLVYLKNFARPIPQDVIDKIKEVNDWEVFDNYVIMYYDPKNRACKETKMEEAKRKDPILFGVIAGSRKLYYITDWIDEDCDLTLEKFVDKLGTTKDEFLVGGEPKKEPEPATENETKKSTKKSSKKKDN